MSTRIVRRLSDMDDKTVTSIGTAHVRNIILSLVQLFLQSVLWVFFSEPFDSKKVPVWPVWQMFPRNMGSQQPFKINTFCTFGNHFHQELLYQWFLLATGARNFSHWFTFISTPNFRDLTLRITCMFMVHVMFWTQTDQMRSRRFVNGTSDAVVMARSIWTVMLVSVNKAMFHQSSCTISSTYAFD